MKEDIVSFIKEINSIALLSFILGAIGYANLFLNLIHYSFPVVVYNFVGLFSTISGIVALFWIKKTRERGRWFAIFGIAIGIILLMLM